MERQKDALRRVTIALPLNAAEMLDVERQAREAGMSPANWIRARIGLVEVWPGRPQADEVQARIRDAYTRLERCGENPLEWFSAGGGG